MYLDDIEKIQTIDVSNMLACINGLPNQLEIAYRRGFEFEIPKTEVYHSIIIAGMGGSAMGADLLIGYVMPDLQIPATVIREYDLPGWASGRNCLVICSSHSGNTEETISIFKQAIKRNCTVVVITTGGQLLKAAQECDATIWQFNHTGQPRTAVGWSFGLLLSLFCRLSLVSDKKQEISNASASMKLLLDKIGVEKQTALNPAKRLAGQLVDQYVSVFSADHMKPVARRWKTQVNELAKAWSQFEFIPEADHNTLAGIINPDGLLPNLYTIFLRSNHISSRNLKRMDLTFTEFMVAGLCTDQVDFSAPEPLSEIWNAILFGDYVSYYLAMMYEIDPTPVDVIASLKEQL